VDQLDLCAQIRALAIRQFAAIETEDFASFDALSAERDALVARLTTPRERSIRNLVQRLLRQVLEIDARAQALLRKGLDETRIEMGQLRQGHRAVRAYAPRIESQGLGARV
jgi:hypothetical protein